MSASPSPPSSWRDLLARLIVDTAERQRAAQELGVNPQTLVRWASGESEPRFQNLKKLPEVFPAYHHQLAEMIQRELYADLPPLPPLGTKASPAQPEVPSEYYFRDLAAYATASGPFRSWMLRKMSLPQLLEFLDPEQVGIEVTLARCVPPQADLPVRSLCEIIGMGTGPWKSNVSKRLQFLGAESLAGYVVQGGEPGILEDMKPGLIPFRVSPHEQSAAAYPLMRAGRVAGCLLASCTQERAWTSQRRFYLEAYSYILALSFQDTDFYDLSRMKLHEIPLPDDMQQTMTSAFAERVRSVRREQGYYLAETEAEVMVLQQMEAELLAHTSQ